MENIKAFLVEKGCPVESWDDDKCKQVARVLGYTQPEARIEPYTPQRSKKGVGTYLVLEPKDSRGAFFRLNDGETLTEEGKAKLTGLVNAMADLLDG